MRDRRHGSHVVGGRLRGEHANVERAAAIDQRGDDRGPRERSPRGPTRLADDDLAHVPLARVAGGLVGDVLARDDDRLGTELLRQLESARDALELGGRPMLKARRLDEDGEPRNVAAFRDATAGPYEPFGEWAAADRDH